MIIDEFSTLLKEFRMQRFNLLWRDRRNDFTAWEFHRHCDGCAKTLTLISDIKLEHTSQEEKIDEIT
jgi:hypothetical protein